MRPFEKKNWVIFFCIISKYPCRSYRPLNFPGDFLTLINGRLEFKINIRFAHKYVLSSLNSFFLPLSS